MCCDNCFYGGGIDCKRVRDVKTFTTYGCWRSKKIFNFKRQNPNTYKQTQLVEVKK
jgi:hypothetical protein